MKITIELTETEYGILKAKFFEVELKAEDKIFHVSTGFVMLDPITKFNLEIVRYVAKADD